MYEKYAKGTIKVKNSNGELIPFYPNLISDNVLYDDQTLTDKILGINQRVEIASQKPTIKVMYEEPSSGNTYTYPNKTMFAWIDFPEVPSDTWQIVVDTRLYDNTGTNAISAIPFNLYNQSITLTVDWGDETTSTLNSSNYTNTDSRASQHTYSTPGEYTIKIKSSNWSNTKFTNYSLESWSSSYNNKMNFLTYFRKTLTSIESSIPAIYGTEYWISTSSSSKTFTQNSLRYLFGYCYNLSIINPNVFSRCTNLTDFSFCFYYCSSLTSIPIDLFRYNTAVTIFSGCFFRCSSLTSIPAGLFDNNTAVTNFTYCFSSCYSLKTIPEHLFDNCINVTTFSNCFYGCSSLTSIPTNLFRYNTGVTDFSYCFQSCSSLTSIPTNLFKYNTGVTDFSFCFYECYKLFYFTLHIGSPNVTNVNYFIIELPNQNKTIYVPSNSTTYNTFISSTISTYATITGE